MRLEVIVARGVIFSLKNTVKLPLNSKEQLSSNYFKIFMQNDKQAKVINLECQKETEWLLHE